jgi:hypothetical protein
VTSLLTAAVIAPSRTLYWGLQIYEWLTLAAILIGPIVAVIITLATEARRRTREQQTQTLRMLLSTRHLPSDPAYSTAINMIPIDFNRESGVMTAWNNYITTIKIRPAPEGVDAHQQDIITKQTKLIFQMTKSLEYKLDETDIQSTAYAAEGFINRDNLMVDAWRAWPRIADALETQTQLIDGVQSAESTGEKE